MRVLIRKAVKKDWRIIQRLNNEVFEDNKEYDKFLMKDYALSKTGVEYFKKITSDPSFYCIIAGVEGKPVGYLVATKKIIPYRAVKTIELDNMGVSPSFRSKGIGTQLVKALKRWAKKHSFDTVYVNSYINNVKAIDFYKRSGFSPIDISLEVTLKYI